MQRQITKMEFKLTYMIKLLEGSRKEEEESEKYRLRIFEGYRLRSLKGQKGDRFRIGERRLEGDGGDVLLCTFCEIL